MKLFTAILFFFLFLTGAFSQTRNVIVNTNSVIVQPTNFWSADAANARTGLGLGSAATNPASAFQPSSSVLTNLASSNAINLTNIRATNIVGTVALSLGGTGATNAAGARTNLGLGWSALINSNAATGLLGYTQPAGQEAFVVNPPLPAELIIFTNITVQGNFLGNYTVGDGQTIGFDTDPAPTRTNLGLGWSALTNTNAATSLLGYTTNGQVVANTGENVLAFTNTLTTRRLIASGSYASSIFRVENYDQNNWGFDFLATDESLSEPTAYNAYPAEQWSIAKDAEGLKVKYGASNSDWGKFVYLTASNDGGVARTNLGLGWSALTNTNTTGFNSSLYGSNTNPVLVGSNGSVVSPTNFWQVAPIQTVVQNFTPVVNATNNATNARTLYVYSLATNVSGVTNTVVLPTNTATFVGDTATVIHRGTTSSTTAIRIAGQSTNVITISNYDDAVKLIHEDGSWSFYHNIGFVEPIRFIDGDIELNQASSRTNLGIPLTILTNTNKATFQEALFNTNSNPASGANFGDRVAWMEVNIITNGVTNSFRVPLYK